MTLRRFMRRVRYLRIHAAWQERHHHPPGRAGLTHREHAPWGQYYTFHFHEAELQSRFTGAGSVLAGAVWGVPRFGAFRSKYRSLYICIERMSGIDFPSPEGPPLESAPSLVTGLLFLPIHPCERKNHLRILGVTGIPIIPLKGGTERNPGPQSSRRVREGGRTDAAPGNFHCDKSGYFCRR